jgi:hypothetical protein
MGKNLERNIKILRLFLVQFLIIGLFVNSLLPKACFCGEACLHGLQGTAKARLSFPFHNRCSGTQCTSCSVEDVKSIKLSNAAHSTEKLKILYTPFILFNSSDYQSNIKLIKIFFPRPDECVNVQSPPRYLQNLSLLL